MNSGPVEAYLEILRGAGVLPQRCSTVIVRKQCAYKAKHALIPSYGVQAWADALAHTPLAPVCLPGAPFIGVYLCGRERPHEDTGPEGEVTVDTVAVATLLVQGDLYWKRSSGVAAEVLQAIFCHANQCSPERVGRVLGPVRKGDERTAVSSRPQPRSAQPVHRVAEASLPSARATHLDPSAP